LLKFAAPIYPEYIGDPAAVEPENLGRGIEAGICSLARRNKRSGKQNKNR
jgi:hypothetical protein